MLGATPPPAMAATLAALRARVAALPGGTARWEAIRAAYAATFAARTPPVTLAILAVDGTGYITVAIQEALPQPSADPVAAVAAAIAAAADAPPPAGVPTEAQYMHLANLLNDVAAAGGGTRPYR